MKKFASMSTQLSPIGLGTGLGLYKKKNNYTETLFKNYFKLCKKFNVKLIDTSPAYGNGASEILIGKYFSKYRKDFFIATKILPEMCSKKKVKISVEQSLKRLKTDYIDLLQIHWPNENIPFEITISEMLKLKKRGIINHIGLCNFSFDQIFKLTKMFKKGTISSVQVEYNLFERSAEKKLAKLCEKKNISIISYGPLAQGKFANGKKQLQLLKKISKKYNCSISQVILAWIKSKKNFFSIPNTSSYKNLVNNFGAIHLKLKQEDIKLIDTKCRTPVLNIDTRKIRVKDNCSHKVYSSLKQAIENKSNMTPSPLELSKEIIKGNFLKPIRLKRINKNKKNIFYLSEGRLRYWSWIIAHGWKKPIPSLVWEN